MRLALTLGGVLLALTNSAFAWNDVGHMTVARIAYSRLTEEERSSVVEILRHHPHLREVLLKGRPANVPEREWIFLTAATWPDHIRPPRGAHQTPVNSHSIYRFHHATWHYANFEYRAGQRETWLPDAPLPHFPHPSNPSDQTDVVEQLDRSYRVVRGMEPETSHPEIELQQPEIRAIRLCWMFHLIGDIHQPLHVVALVDDKIPALKHGDEGGNKLMIRINHAAAPRKLHTFWDDLLGTSERFEHIVDLAEMMTRDPRLAPTRFPEYTSHKLPWEFAEESYQIAKEVVYQNGRLHFALSSRLDAKEITANDVPVLSQQAVDQAHATAFRRITLAGYRLADRLKFIVSRDRSLAPREIASPQRTLR